MKLEVGKYYKTRDGEKVGPMKLYRDGSLPFEKTHPWKGVCSKTYMDNGKYGLKCDTHCDEDLIAEWQDEPTPLTAIEHLRKAAELFLAAGNKVAAFEVLGVVINHE